LVGSATGAENLVSNGGFESPVVPTQGSFTIVPNGGTIGPWTVSGIHVDHLRPDWPVSEGAQAVDLSGSPGAGAVYQILSTEAGQSYLLRFAMAGNFTPWDGNPNNWSPAVKEMEVVWDGELVDTVTFDVTGHDASDPGWVYLSYGVTAESSATELRFVSLTGGAYGPLLDDVSVRVPEPATLAVLAVGGLRLLRRRRRA
jgi:choice-of-anchor C domain-containing protein